MVIRRGDDDRLISEGVQVLDEAVHHTLQLSEFMVVAAQLCDSVKFIEKKDAGCFGRKVKKGANVFRRAAEERRDQAIQSGNIEVKTQFFGDVPDKTALPC